MNDSTKHPQKDQLIAFGLGKLDPDEANQVAEHLYDCPDCSETIVNLQDDTFVSLVRSSPAPAPVDEAELEAAENQAVRPDVTVDVESGVTGEPGSPAELPPELRDHPRYEILELIGRGGMGDVYKAQHKVMNRVVALKVIKPELVKNGAAVERFRREVQAAAKLRHGKIVTAHDAEQAGNLHFLVMEYVDGTSLDEMISAEGPLPVEVACDYVRQTAEGLQYAHHLGMVHRDIKPHNLMIERPHGTPMGSATVVKILDFGLANFANEVAVEELEATSDGAQLEQQPSRSMAPGISIVRQLTQMGTMMGTPDYIAPEQAVDAHTADIRSDIYSLGCTFYTLLTGKAPFGEGSVMEKIKAHSQREVPPTSDFRDDVPAEVEAIVLKMTAKDPAARYQTPQEVVDALRAFIDQRIDDRLRDYEAGRPPSKPLEPATGESPDEIRKWYGRIADVMLSVGLINLVSSIVGFVIIAVLADVGPEYRAFAYHPLTWAALVTSFISGILLLTVVRKVRRMERYRHVLFGVFLCMLPTPGAFLGIPTGLITLFYLLSAECRRPLGASEKPSLRDGVVFAALLLIPVVTFGAAASWYVERGTTTTVTFQIEAPSLAVQFQDQKITQQNDGRSISIPWDEQQRFTIQRDGEPLETATFRLKQGQHTTLQILSADGIPMVVATGGVAVHQQRILEPLLEEGITLAHTYLGHTDYIDAAAFTDGKVLSGSAGGVWQFGLSQDYPAVQWKEQSRVFSIAASSDGLKIALGCDEGTIVLYHGQSRVSWTANEPEEGRRDLNRVLALEFSPDSRRLLSGGDDGVAYEWTLQEREGNVPERRLVRTFGEKGSRRNIESVAYSGDGRRIMTAGYDKIVRLYDAETGQLQTEIKDAAERADLSPDGRLVISGAMLYDADSGQPLRSLDKVYTHMIGSVAFTPDGQHVIGGLTNRTIRVWVSATGKEVARAQHGSQVTTKIALSPDGQFVASWRNDRGEEGDNLCVWRLPESVWPEEPKNELKRIGHPVQQNPTEKPNE